MNEPNDSCSLAGAVLAAALAVSLAQAQQAMRIRGPIKAVDGAVLTVTAGEAGDVKVRLTDDVAVFGVVNAHPGRRQAGRFHRRRRDAPGGRQPARHPGHDFQRAAARHRRRTPALGSAQHHHDQCHGGQHGGRCRRPGGHGQVQGRREEDHRRSRGRDPRLLVGSKDELKPGASINIVRATKGPDGTFEAARVNVGRGGVAP